MLRMLGLTAAMVCMFRAELNSSAEQAAPPKPRVFDTPQACYEASIELGKNTDAAAILSCYTVAMRNYLIGQNAALLDRMASGEKVSEKTHKAAMEISTKHGLINRDVAGFLKLSPLRSDRAAALMQIGASIKSHEAFLRDFTELALRDLAESRGVEVEDIKKEALQELKSQSAPKLEELKIDGETAQGIAKVPELQFPLPAYFKREQGSWRMAYAATEPDWTQPIQGKYQFQDHKKP
jgi:hypothetical protein